MSAIDWPESSTANTPLNHYFSNDDSGGQFSFVPSYLR